MLFLIKTFFMKPGILHSCNSMELIFKHFVNLMNAYHCNSTMLLPWIHSYPILYCITENCSSPKPGLIAHYIVCINLYFSAFFVGFLNNLWNWTTSTASAFSYFNLSLVLFFSQNHPKAGCGFTCLRMWTKHWFFSKTKRYAGNCAQQPPIYCTMF